MHDKLHGCEASLGLGDVFEIN